jgi:hypothetical protein
MLYSDVYVDEPLDKIAGDWDFLNERVIKKFYGFRDIGDNVVGVRSIEIEKPPELGQKAVPVALPAVRKNFEIGPNGIVTVPRIPFSAHITRAGTPHHTQHVFGYWHINDKDEIIIPLPPEGDRPGRILIIMGRPNGDEADRFAFYCEECLTLLFMREWRDFNTFWTAERNAIREYNSDPKNQLCPSCGHRNPLGYTAMQASDRPEEREARFQW